MPFTIEIPIATPTIDGLMSAADKAKLDRLSGDGDDGGGETPSFIIVTEFPGTDLSAKLNAADAFLGDTRGTLYVPPGNYLITTQTVLQHPGRIVWFGAGYYRNDWPSDTDPWFLYQDEFTFRGDGWNTIIEQPRSGFGWSPFNYWVGNNHIGHNNLAFHDFQAVRPNNPKATYGGFEQVIQLDNAQRSRINNFFLNGCVGYVCAGGVSDNATRWSDVTYVTNCYFQRDDTKKGDGIKLAFVNSTRFIIANNILAGGASIDLEVNVLQDHMNDWCITSNVMTGGGVIEISGASDVGGTQADGLIYGNQMNGKHSPGAFGHEPGAATAIAVNRFRNVLVTNNNIRNYGASTAVAINVAASENTTVDGNKITDSGDQAGIRAQHGSKRTTITNNDLYAPTPGPTIYGGTDIVEEDTSDGTIVMNNRQGATYQGKPPKIVLVGANSRKYNNVMLDVLVP